MTLLLMVLLLTASPDTVDVTTGLEAPFEVPEMLQAMEGSAPWVTTEYREGTGVRRYATAHGWYAYVMGPVDDPRAIWGRDTSQFVWVWPMERIYYIEESPRQQRSVEVRQVGLALYDCLFNGRWRDCRLLRDMLRTQLSKEG